MWSEVWARDDGGGRMEVVLLLLTVVGGVLLLVLGSAIVGSFGASFGRVDLRLLILELGMVVDDHRSVRIGGGSSVRFDTVELALAFLFGFLLVMMSKGVEVGLYEYLC
jgi:hypothetical protein